MRARTRRVITTPGELPAFKEGQVVSVCVQGNPMPLAVGAAGMSSEQAQARTSGKLVEVHQVRAARGIAQQRPGQSSRRKGRPLGS